MQSKEVVKSPISRVINSNDGLRYERVITLNKNIGYDKFSVGKATSTITILTDKFGNLVTVTPGRIK